MLSRFRALMITLPVTVFLAFGLSACATESEMEPAAGETEEAAAAGNPITGEGIPNPTSTVIENWGDLPEGREWGSTAGIDIDTHDGQVWAYERCGAGNFGGEWQSTATRTLSIRSLSLTATLGKCWPTSVEVSWSRRTASTWMLTATYG